MIMQKVFNSLWVMHEWGFLQHDNEMENFEKP